MLPETAAILKAARIPPDVHIDNPDLLATAITNDGEVRDCALQAAIDAYILEGIPRVESFVRLHKRVGVPQPAPAPVKESINWRVQRFPYDSPGEFNTLVIHASVPGEFICFSGAPQAAPKFQFHGQTPPAPVIEEYARRYRKEHEVAE